MTWQPSTYGEGLRMAWDEDDDGVEHCLRHIEPHLPKTGVVVDIGCGVGRLTVPLAEKYPGLQLVGVDSSVEMLVLAMQRSAEVAWHLDMPPAFDFAFSVVTFQHISDTDMRAYLRACAQAEAPIVFQFVAGEERVPLSMQRDSLEVLRWTYDAGYRHITMSKDERFPNWRWVHAR